MASSRIVVSGASGFIGSCLLARGIPSVQPICLRGDKWKEALARQKPTSIVHFAGLAQDWGSDETVQKVNVGGTKALAEEAVRCGVKRFVFLSSIQVVAEKPAKDESVNTNTSATPQGAYGRSKLEAEQLLRTLSMESQMEVVIIRPPLVYGPGVKANFRNLLQLADKGIPLPIGALKHNRRSFVGVSNLIDLILLCLEHPAAANQTFHVSDDDDISTAELLRRMGKALGKPVRNLPIPQAALKTGLRLVGKGDWVDKLFGDLKVDISETKRMLGWKPKVTMGEELERTAKWWREREK
jgi:UDP-glucose 4-epimerase